MLQLTFSQNWNGKLFNDCFGDIRLHDPQLYIVGHQVEVIEKSMYHGIAEIVAVRNFKYRQIRDVLAFLNVGKPAHYQAELIKRFSGFNLNEETLLDHIVLRYVERQKETQSNLMQLWWNNK